MSVAPAPVDKLSPGKHLGIPIVAPIVAKMPAMAGPATRKNHFAPGIAAQNILRLSGRVFASLCLVAAITFVCFRLIHVNATTVGFFYLVAILMVAAAWGLAESTVASIVAMLCFNFYFIPPIGTLTVDDPQNWVALFAFLATSLTASHLSARAKGRTKEAVERQHEIERLYSLSRALLLTESSRPVPNQVVQQIARIFDFESVALYDRASREIHRVDAGDLDDMPDIESALRESAARSTVIRDESRRLIVTPIRLGEEPIGSLAVRGASLSDAALQSLLNLVAIGMERARSQETVNRAEVARQSEELKSTLLDAIAHEFKTPLTSIKAVTTDLLSEPAGELQPHQRELIGIADEGTDRLSRLVTDAIQLARIEGGTFRLDREVHFPASLIRDALRQMKSLTDRRQITVTAVDDLPLVQVDAPLVRMVITHLIANALKYSPPRTTIAIGARVGNKGAGENGEHENKVVVYVRDHGPGIAEEEQPRIFEKFYRGTSERHLTGSGMGLAIARAIICAHGEEIWVTSKPGEGSEFSFSLPVAPQGQTPSEHTQ
jgi:two-component system sensor histidine kinase KdpD